MTPQEAQRILQAWYADASKYITYLYIYKALYRIFLPDQTLWWAERIVLLDDLAMLASMSDDPQAMQAYITLSK